MALHSNIEKHLLQQSLLSYCLYPFSLLFSIILVIRRWLYKKCIFQYKAEVFVISIGNITAGGSGKTPFTIFLTNLLTKHNLKVGVSHRGYRSALEGKTTLISNMTELLPEADMAGDEAWLIAHRLIGIPVVVGKNRKHAIKLMLKEYPYLDCIILDDSFQNLKVVHDLDFIIINDQVGFGNGFVLPAGYLREPISALSDADAFVLNKTVQRHYCEDRNPILTLPGRQPDFPYQVQKYLDKFKKISFTGSYNPDCVYDFTRKEISFQSISEKSIMLLSGIGNPSGFAETAKAMAIKVVYYKVLSDHCDYRDIKLRQQIIRDFEKSGAELILTTEKDYAKLRHYPEFKACLLILGISFVLDNKTDILLSYIMQKMSNTKVAN